MEDKVIIVSCDSHAGVPKDRWEEYLPKAFHAQLASLRQDNVIYPTAMYLLKAKNGTADHPEHVAAHRDDWHGLHDPVLRMADMDREGIAAELIYHGDFRQGDMFHNVSGRDYGLEAWEAGARGWNRWAAETFGFAPDRFLLTGAIGPCVDMGATVAELNWIADRKFVGTYGPGYMRHPGTPPLFDSYWDPFWTTCVERQIAMVVHAGFNTVQGQAFPAVERIYNEVAAAAGTTDPDVLLEHVGAVSAESQRFFFEFLNKNLDSRRPMWQMMLGGVFDRHPDLKVVLTEIRCDWIPATLAHLDRVWESHRGSLPARRKPSEYWPTNFLAGASFIHRAEVEQRHELGVNTVLFGRDFPHPEGTWPHTKDFLRAAFADVPENELRLMLGHNGIRFLGLDEKRLAEIAKRIGPTVEEIIGGHEVRPDLIESFSLRGGFLKPFEGEEKIPALKDLVADDLAGLGATT